MHRTLTIWLAIWSMLTYAAFSHAGELLDAKANETDGHYTLSLDMRIHGKYADVYAVLLDFDHLPAINDTVKQSQLLKQWDNKYLVAYSSEGCVLFFCRTVKQVATVTELGRGYIMSQVDPTQSDMKYGRALWQVIDEGEHTRIKYNADYVPDFWVPPVIGDYIFRKRMIEEGIKTVNGIEKLVGQHEAEDKRSP